VDFARSTVWVDAQYAPDRILLRIVDDGEGFPAQVLGRIGDPFLRSRRDEQDLARRPEYEGMGLGLFIAKTLLERTGAELSFANAGDPFLTPQERPARSGAIVEVTWKAEDILVNAAEALGENPRFVD
jgi:two-component system sensor histidine kinase RegB